MQERPSVTAEVGRFSSETVHSDLSDRVQRPVYEAFSVLKRVNVPTTSDTHSTLITSATRGCSILVLGHRLGNSDGPWARSGQVQMPADSLLKYASCHGRTALQRSQKCLRDAYCMPRVGLCWLQSFCTALHDVTSHVLEPIRTACDVCWCLKIRR